MTPDPRPARLRVGIVGAGRVGAVLGAALVRSGHRVMAVSAVSPASRARAELLLPGVPVRPVPDVLVDAELVLLSVPDDELGPLVAGLTATGSWVPSQLVAHTSGRHGLGVMAPAAAVISPLALHPAMTFEGAAADLERLAGCCFAVTAPQQLRLIGEALVVEMGGDPVWVRDADRPAYHAALTHGANHLVTLVAQAMQVLRGAGVSDPQRVLGPLLSAALDGALRHGDAAVTGPVSRADAGTVVAHVRELGGESADVLPTYVALARATAMRALADGRLTPEATARVLDALAPRRSPK